MFNFEHKEYLWLLGLIPVWVVLFILQHYRRKRDLRRLGNPTLLTELMPGFSPFRRGLKFSLLMLVIGLIIVALAGPRFGSKLTQVKQNGIDIIFALDVSNSMLAEDIKPNRLERAKQELSRLLDRLDENRIGLIVFAGEAYTQIPITNDYLSAKMFLSGITTEMVSRQGTAIGQAIELAVRSFSSASEAGKALVIISDGENHEGGIEDAIKKAREKNITIFTIGMGTGEGVRIPLNNAYNRDYRRDKDGNFVITRMNEQMLVDIASEGKGRYYRANMPDMGLNNILSELEKLDKAESETKVYTEYEQQFPGLIWIALALLALESILLERKNKWLGSIHLFDRLKRNVQ
ncbi:MAG: VWA domain-containing protein [Bacteroidales bacterium]|nr:VWA domain-containing protein [Bacteroidales bacterium]